MVVSSRASLRSVLRRKGMLVIFLVGGYGAPYHVQVRQGPSIRNFRGGTYREVIEDIERQDAERLAQVAEWRLG